MSSGNFQRFVCRFLSTAAPFFSVAANSGLRHLHAVVRKPANGTDRRHFPLTPALPMNSSFAKYQLRLRDAPFPSPRPSPRGRGRIASRSGTGPDALVCRETRAAWLPPHEPVLRKVPNWTDERSLPPHPDPLPWGEGESLSELELAKRFWFVRTGEARFPLPKGEGQGEGEQGAGKPHA